MQDHYMFFDLDGMPVAVFYVEEECQAIKLFCKLYRDSWDELSKEFKIKVVGDVSQKEWHRICNTEEMTLPPKRDWPVNFIEQLVVIKALRPLVVNYNG